MNEELVFPKRTIHLDFHTSPDIPDIGKDFDSEEFARTFKQSHVDSVTVFATCHHGMAYWDTDRDERHPGLAKGFDLLGEQIEALHRVGIRAPVYLSVLCNDYCARNHPEWISVDEDGKLIRMNGGGVFDKSPINWYVMDMSSPYQDYLTEQLSEVLEKYAPLDGVFLDMCWDQPSCSKWAIEGMRGLSLDPSNASDRNKYATHVSHKYMARYRKMVDDAHRHHPPVGIWFNGRPKTNIHIEKKFLRHVEIEALPTGGWGYSYFPYVSRFVRPLGLPTLSHTGRFHKTWGDFGGLKPRAALMYECCSILAQGMTNGVGDQLHPRGNTNKAVYELIGSVYSHIKKCEPFVEGGEIISQIAIITDPLLGDKPGAAAIGALRALQQLRHQFDIVPPQASLDNYDLVVIPESTKIDETLRMALKKYLADGGALILSGMSAVDDNLDPLFEESGIEADGILGFSSPFIAPGEKISCEIPAFDYVMYEPGTLRLKAKNGAESLAEIIEPYFERSWDRFCSHGYTPASEKSGYSAIVKNGRVITCAAPIFQAYGNHAAVVYRKLIGNCIDLLLPEPLIRDDGPSHLETTVVRKGHMTIVHLLSYIAQNRADKLEIIEDAFPLVGMSLSLRLAKRPNRVSLQPDNIPLNFNYNEGYATVEITEDKGHTMVLFE